MGEEILAPDGQIDKGRMAQKIFADAALLAQVNGLIHPAVKDFLLERLSEAKKKGSTELFFVEAALLIEGGYGSLVDEMWYIYTAEDVRRKRLKEARGYSDEKITQIMERQLKEEKFRENCDFTIDNSGSFSDSCRQIKEKLEAFTWQE
jgi:dephospho-CoA kinase